MGEGIRAGDERTFERLYSENATGLLGYALRLSGSREIAQDVVAELFVQLWDQRAEWRPRVSVRAYLYTAIRHRIANAVRAERRGDARAGRVVTDPSLAPSAPAAPDAAFEMDERLAVVWHVVDGFPPLRRQVMYLRWARGLSPEEVATVLGLNRNAVDKHLSRAMQAIRDAMPGLIAGE